MFQYAVYSKYLHLVVIPSGGGPHLDQFKENMTTMHVINGQNACPWVAHHFSCHVVLCPIDGAQITLIAVYINTECKQLSKESVSG